MTGRLLQRKDGMSSWCCGAWGSFSIIALRPAFGQSIKYATRNRSEEDHQLLRRVTSNWQLDALWISVDRRRDGTQLSNKLLTMPEKAVVCRSACRKSYQTKELSKRPLQSRRSVVLRFRAVSAKWTWLFRSRGARKKVIFQREISFGDSVLRLIFQDQLSVHVTLYISLKYVMYNAGFISFITVLKIRS